MESNNEELNLNMSKEVCGNKWGSDGFIDRSKVRILLCDNDSKCAEEVLTLLLKCSYQVTAVRSARQVIDALNAEGPDIDIILAEVDLPMAKGMKMLKYIMRDKKLRRIPVIMMSAQDEVSTVVKCLRLGAADYLVKPLRTNELLNLWTHMWRRRRMLGLADKNIMNYDLELVASDPSDANTNSTTLFSDDTDDKSRKSANPESEVPTHQDNNSTAVAAAAPVAHSVEPQVTAEHPPDVPGISDRKTEQLSTGPKKSELRIGGSSAFFTYVKSSPVKNTTQVCVDVDDIAGQHWKMGEEPQACQPQAVSNAQQHENEESWKNNSPGDDFPSSYSVPDYLSVERSCTPPWQTESPQQKKFVEDKFCQVIPHPRNEPQLDNPGLPTPDGYPYYLPGVMSQVMMPPASAQMYHKNLHELQNHPTSAMLPQYSHLHQCPPHVAGMPPFPYYPISLCVQPGQMSGVHHAWQSMGGPSSAEVKTGKVDRREAALMKFRQKRKERCFDKKIRYVNRKRLAERRPRVRGQFVRKVNGINVDLNGQPTADYDEDEEEDEEHASRDSSPEDDTSGY